MLIMDLFKKEEQGNQQNIPKPEPVNNRGSKSSTNDKAVNIGDVSKEVTSLIRKVRINEERDMNQRKKIQLIEQNILLHHKKLVSEIKFINTELNEIKLNFENLKSKLAQFSHQMNNLAKKEDFAVLERYINLWEPVNFVTRKEVENIITDILKDKKR
jgi:tryptophanyl-tRNA synthetase